MQTSPSTPKDYKRLFWKLGTCSRTMCHILDRQFDCPNEPVERAADPLAGGIYRKGHQCGMLWGGALAVGAESFRRCADRGVAVAAAISATQQIAGSFTARTGTVNCREITGCDWTNTFSFLKHMLSGKFLVCFDLMGKWAPEARPAAVEAVAYAVAHQSGPALSCATQVVKAMGGSEEESVTVAGFAGGIGLSGNGCGALAAAIWKRTLDRCKIGKSTMFGPEGKKTLKVFTDTVGSELLCRKVCGREFKTIDEHTEFVKNGGCEKLINALAGA